MFKFLKRSSGAREIKIETGSVRSRMIFLPVLALALTLVLELCNRGLSVVRLFQFITQRPG
jgi:hypothetical protein